MIDIEIISQAQKELEKIGKTDKRLYAEIIKKLEQMEKGNFEVLDIKNIKRDKGFDIMEIRIKFPSSYRVFYFEILKKEKIWIIAGIRKKVDALSSDYFKMLDERIKSILEGENEVK